MTRASLTEYGCRPSPAGSRSPARAYQGLLAIRSVPAAFFAGRNAQTVAADEAKGFVIYAGKRPEGSVTANPPCASTTSSPGAPLGHVAGHGDQGPHTALLPIRNGSGEGDQRTDGLRGAAVEFLGVCGLHDPDVATIGGVAASNLQRQFADFMRGIPYVVC